MEKITEWLASLGLSEYAPRFLEQQIDFSVLCVLTDQDLKDLGVSLMGHRRRFLLAISRLGDAGSAAADKPAAAEVAPVVTAEATLRPEPDAGAARSAGAERRHLTVMFCDLVGSTALAAQLDPEDMRDVVRAYQAACAQVIANYEGFLAQYLGDGVMAYFGYPQAHEDDAERAARSGLDLIAAVAKLKARARVEVRVGIATGLVVVGDLIGEHAAKERAVTGETPNLAARLQGLANPGSIVMSAATRRLLGGVFELRDLGSQQVKGLNAPVQAFVVEGVRSLESRFEARAGGLTGFVGREDEAEHLLERKKLAWQGRGQVVLVSGEAGIGKSRLTAWLLNKVSDAPHVRLRYQCTPHHKDSALHPFVTQLEYAAGLSAGDTADQKLEKLEALLALARLETAYTVPLFAALLAIPTMSRYPPLDMSPAQQRRRTMAAMLDQTEALGRQKPVLFVFEDAHWADATSLELLDMLVERISRLPVLAIITGRPEFSPRWAGHHTVSALTLSRLDRRQARAMIDSVAGGAALPAAVLEQIVAKTDGVPLFVEELTKTVLESGLLLEEGQGYRLAGPLPALAIPATLHDSLMARLDRSNPVKEIAQIGAAIGRQFSYKLLIAVAGMDEASVRAALAKLEEAELATRRGVPPHATYTFKHALVQDAAYESQLKSRRQTIHRRIAKALRDQFPEVAETEPEIIAHHFTQAGQSETGVDWWTKAGELALRRSAYVEAIGHFEKGIKLADSLPDDPARLPLRLRLQNAYSNALLPARGHGAIETTAAFARSAELAMRSGDVTAQFAGYYGVWSGSFVRGEVHRARELAEEYLSKMHGMADGPEVSVGHRIIGATLWNQGEYTEAAPHLERALEIYRFDRDLPAMFLFAQDIGLSAMVCLMHGLWPLGQVDRARAIADQTVAHAMRTKHTNTIGFAHVYGSVFEAMRRDTDRTRPHAEAMVRIGREHGTKQYLAFGNVLLGWTQWRAGEKSIGVEAMQEGLAVIRTQGYNLFKPVFDVCRAEVWGADDPDAGLATIKNALTDTELSGQKWFDAELSAWQDFPIDIGHRSRRDGV